MAKKAKFQSFVSPKGEAKFPYLNTPDEYNGKKSYKVDLLYAPGDAAVDALVEKLEAIRDEFIADAIKADPKKKKGWSTAPVLQEELDKEGDETGRMFLRFKMNAEIKNEKSGKVTKLKPTLFDAKGAKTDVEVWGGSILKIAFEAVPYAMGSSKTFGVSLRMNAVQVIELRSGSARDASGFGFEEEEGYDSSEDEDEQQQNGSAFAGNDGDSEDDDESQF